MSRTVALRRLVTCLDRKRVPLNREERSDMQGQYPYWGAGSVVDHINQYLFDEELVLLGEDGAPFFDDARPVAFRVTGPVWVNNHIHVLRAQGGVDARFLTYCLNVVDYSRHIGGSTRDKLTQDDMLDIPVPDVRIDSQRRTADYLDDQVDRIDSIIVTRRSQRLALAVAYEAELEQVLWSDSLGIAIRRLGASVTTGPFGSVFAASEYVEDGVPMINPTHISDGGLVPDRTHSVSPATAARLERHRLNPGDIVTGRKGDLGRSAVVGADQAGWMCGSDSIAIHRQGSRLDPSFLELVLHLPRIRSQLVADSAGATMPSLNEGMLLSVEVPDVSFDEQQRRAGEGMRLRSEHVRLIESLDRSVELLEEMKRSLITAAVRGEFDVSSADGTRMLV